MDSRAGERWAIVLAGGSGTRLGALTAAARGEAVPKQYCSLEGGPSLLGSTLERAARLAGEERTVVVVAAQHRRYFEPELAHLAPENVIVQPRERGTAAGVLLPLWAVLRRDPGALVTLLPSDHFVERERVLRGALREAAERARADDGVRLLGIAPEHPETQYGWIVPSAEPGRVEAFVEKPDPALAAELARRGGVWNSFLVVARGRALLELYQERLPGLVDSFRAALGASQPQRAAAVERLYECIDRRDFCRDLLEGSEERLRLSVVPPCGWTDLGTPERVAECLARRAPGGAGGKSTQAPVVLAQAFEHWAAALT